jgi:uncharacterized membrane protein YbhN (UPF0104 family)
LRFVFGLGVLAIAVYVLDSHSSELSTVPTVFSHLRWGWMAPALLVELASFVCFARMENELLVAGGLEAPQWPLLEMTFASQSIANSLPAGTAAAAVYGFRWFRRFGADTTLATWALAGTLVASVVSLSLVATLGLALATGEGASEDLVPVLLGVLAVTIGVGVVFVYERPLVFLVTWGVRFSRKVSGRPRGDVAEQIGLAVGWVTVVRLGWTQIGRTVGWGAGNWLLDCACFAMMFPAVGARIPWEGLLLAYGAGQLAANLPFTPGGLGAVEGSITIALATLDGNQVTTTTVDAVLLYRILSFWLILLIGWLLFGDLALKVRRGRFTRAVRDTPVEAGVQDIDPSTRPVELVVDAASEVGA